MISEKETTGLSKFLSLVLRHQPEVINIKLDEQGWVAVDELLLKAAAHGKAITLEILNHIVETNAKKRFAFDDARQKIRASQGHSVEVELGYEHKYHRKCYITAQGASRLMRFCKPGSKSGAGSTYT